MGSRCILRIYPDGIEMLRSGSALKVCYLPWE